MNNGETLQDSADIVQHCVTHFDSILVSLPPLNEEHKQAQSNIISLISPSIFAFDAGILENPFEE